MGAGGCWDGGSGGWFRRSDAESLLESVNKAEGHDRKSVSGLIHANQHCFCFCFFVFSNLQLCIVVVIGFFLSSRRLPFDCVVVLELLPADLPGGAELRGHRAASSLSCRHHPGGGEPGQLPAAGLRDSVL